MIEICGKIDLISGADLSISYNSEFDANNISIKSLDNLLGKQVSVGNPFIIGFNVLGDGSTFSEGENYFISSQFSDGADIPKFSQHEYSFTISSSQPFNSLSIAFDTANQRHPITINVDGTDYADDDAIFSIFNLSNSNSHNVTISNWNTAFAPLVISGIYVNISIDINRRNLISFDYKNSDRADLEVPSFGVISNKANLSIKDTNGEIPDYVENGIFSNAKAHIWLNNSLKKGKTEDIAHLKVEKVNYDDISKIADITLTDGIEEWQSIEVPEIAYYREETVDEQPPKNFEWIYDYLLTITHNNGFTNMLKFAKLDNTTQKRLQNRYMKYPLLEATNLWAQWQKLCVALQLHIYQNNNGKIVCEYKGGN